MTEKCFQQGHLQFHGDKQWIELGEDRIEIEAVRTREGTFPEGSQWARSAIFFIYRLFISYLIDFW